MSETMTIRLAISSGGFEEAQAEPCAAGGLSGIHCVHRRRTEAQQAASVGMNWTVTHIASGYAVSHGYTKEDAIREADLRIKRTGKRRFLRLAEQREREHLAALAAANKPAGLRQAEGAMRAAFARGQAPTEWQNTTLLHWARTNPRGGCGGCPPSVCGCTRCGGEAVILPGRFDAKEIRDTQGMCICRTCSASMARGAAA